MSKTLLKKIATVLNTIQATMETIMFKSKELDSPLHPCRADVGGFITDLSSLLLCQLWLLISLLVTHLSSWSGLPWLWSYLASKVDGRYPYTLHCLCIIYPRVCTRCETKPATLLRILKHFFASVWSWSWELFSVECKIFPLTSVRPILFVFPTMLKENAASKANLPETLVITTTVVQRAK